MTKNLVTFKPETDVYIAVDYLLAHKISGAPVVDGAGALVGIFSESDCLRSSIQSTYHEGQGGGAVQDYMTKNVDVVDPEADIISIAELFITKKRRRLPVVERGRLVGQISRRDILRAMKDFSTNREYVL